jgi:signal transduction histidine kinase
VPQPDRLRGLIDAGIALSAELSLDALLLKLAETAAALTGARYAALGVIDTTGSGLERFVYTGLAEETARAIGHLPRGQGILGALITDAQSLRLDAITDDARSAGFPPNHPPMRGFLGVPVRLRGRAYGNLYLTEKAEGPFTAADQKIVEMLAGQAAVAIENARLYEAATRWARQLEGLIEVGNALAAEIDLPRLLALVTERLRELLDARVVAIALTAPDGTLHLEAVAGDASTEMLGLTMEPDRSKSGRVLARRRAERVDVLLDDPEVDQQVAARVGARSGLYVPLIARGEPIGILLAHDRTTADTRFTDEDLRVAETFASRAAVAVELSARVAGAALRRVVEAQELERRRLARELHDQTGQELTSVLLGLKAIEDAPSDAERRAAVAAVRKQVVETLHDVRRLAVELRPKALDDFGLVPALERLVETFAEQTSMRIELEARLGERLPVDVETAIYRIVQEALTNVVKHARATQVSIVLTRTRTAFTALVEDDGVGFDDAAGGDGLGLIGMRERLALLGGRLRLESGATGTTLVAEVPLP